MAVDQCMEAKHGGQGEAEGSAVSPQAPWESVCGLTIPLNYILASCYSHLTGEETEVHGIK